MFPGIQECPQVEWTGRRQCGVLHRDQFRELGLHRWFVRNQLAAVRWAPAQAAPRAAAEPAPTWRQLMWCAVLDAGQPSALCSHTSVELTGRPGFPEEAKSVQHGRGELAGRSTI